MGGLGRTCIAAAACLAAGASIALAKGGAKTIGGEQQQINDAVELAGSWVYDDVDKGFDVAKKEGKPLCFVFR